MGADIHTYVETVKDGYAESVAKLYLPRDYNLFGVLAGVRGIYPPIIEPRGVPDNLGWMADSEYHLLMVDESDITPENILIGQFSDSRLITRDKAQYFLDVGWSTSPRQGYITNPDFHSATYFSPSEYESVLSSYKYSTETAPPREYEALASFLYGLEKARLVMWFDS